MLLLLLLVCLFCVRNGVLYLHADRWYKTPRSNCATHLVTMCVCWVMDYIAFPPILLAPPDSWIPGSQQRFELPFDLPTGFDAASAVWIDPLMVILGN